MSWSKGAFGVAKRNWEGGKCQNFSDSVTHFWKEMSFPSKNLGGHQSAVANSRVGQLQSDWEKVLPLLGQRKSGLFGSNKQDSPRTEPDKQRGP